MPNEDDRFGDVAEQLKQTGKEPVDEDDSSEEDIQPSATGSERERGREPESPQRSDESDEGEPSGGPAFSFDETNMHGFYVRDTTWNGVTRMRSSVTAVCSMFDVPAFEGREFQDACLRVVANHGDEVALQILRERGIEADEGRVEEVVEMLRDHAETD